MGARLLTVNLELQDNRKIILLIDNSHQDNRFHRWHTQQGSQI